MNRKIFVWQGDFVHCTEFLSIDLHHDYLIKGHIAGEARGIPLFISYTIQADPSWVTRSVAVTVESDSTYTLAFSHKDGQAWLDGDGRAVPGLHGCTDVDISMTPFTNALPVNRMRLPVGDSEEIDVLYIDLPKGDFRSVRQRYTHLRQGFYKYENFDSGFTAMLEFDRDGIVIDYPERWRRLFPQRHH